MADQTIPSEGQILYQEIGRFVKRQSARAAAQGDDPRARAVGFLMSLYQRRLASSTYALRHSLENRARRLTEGLKRARELARTAPPDIPSPDELEEMEDHEREKLEELLETRMAVISVSGLGRIPRISGASRTGWGSTRTKAMRSTPCRVRERCRASSVRRRLPGDAELMLGLTASGEAIEEGKACMPHKYMGSIDAPLVRGLVEEVLEGGRAAFEMRWLKYGF